MGPSFDLGPTKLILSGFSRSLVTSLADTAGAALPQSFRTLAISLSDRFQANERMEGPDIKGYSLQGMVIAEAGGLVHGFEGAEIALFVIRVSQFRRTERQPSETDLSRGREHPVRRQWTG